MMKNLFIIVVFSVATGCGNDSQILPEKFELIRQKEYFVNLEKLTIYSFENKINNSDSITSFDFKCCNRNVVINKWESIKDLDNNERLDLINYLDECYKIDSIEEVRFLVNELRYSNNKNYFFAGCYKEDLDKFFYHQILLDTSSNRLYSFEYYD